jgi:Raf kinase inhibitor-like YbhB/YbcL family protein
MKTITDVLSGKPKFNLFSEDIKDCSYLKIDYISDEQGGKNIFPKIYWSDFPNETKAFSIIVFDPDAPKDGGFYHFGIINIPRRCTVMSDELIKTVSLTRTLNDYGSSNYLGAAPPKGDSLHHYHFIVLAHDALFITEKSIKTNSLVLFKSFCDSIIAYAEIVALYENKG